MLPKGIASSAYPSTEAVCLRIGIRFDPWQVDLNKCLLAKTRSGLYAADTALLSIPRQVGKTFDVGAVVFGDSIINPGTTTVWTAHRFKVARESFNEMRAWAKSPLLKPHIDYDEITTGAGNESIPFRNGSRILFAARERGAIRGFTKVRRLVLDEGQILSEQAMADLIPTMNQAVNPQIVLMCTPPKPTDPSEVVSRLRKEALAGDSEGVLYVELSAPRGSDPGDRAAWKKANPSYPSRTPAKAILRMRKLLSPDDFLREALGIWDEVAAHLIPVGVWESRVAAGRPVPQPRIAVAADASPGLVSGAIAVAGRLADGRTLVEIPLDGQDRLDHRPGVGWIVPRLVELRRKYRPAGIVIDPRGPAAGLIPEAEAAGLELVKPSLSESAQAFAQFHAGVCETGTVAHMGQPALSAALGGATVRDTGDGGQLWARRDTSVDISPLVACTLAAWALGRRPSYDLLRSVAPPT